MKLKRKVYTSARERKIDQLIGGGVFILVNIIVWLVILLLTGLPRTGPFTPPTGERATLILLLPWIVNGAVFALALIFRPQLAIGYIALPGLLLFAGIWLGVLFFGACLIGVVAAFPFGNYGGPVLFIVFPGLLIAGAIWSLIKGISWADKWWSSEDKPPSSGT